MHFHSSNGSWTGHEQAHSGQPLQATAVPGQTDLIPWFGLQMTELGAKALGSEVATLHGVPTGAHQADDVLLHGPHEDHREVSLRKLSTIGLLHYTYTPYG